MTPFGCPGYVMVVGGRFPATDPKKIGAELGALGHATAQLRRDGSQLSNIRAAVFFHLRFLAIHPLKDGNGRLSRLLLAIQLSSVLKIAPATILSELHTNEREYRDIFPHMTDVQYELLLDFIGRVFGVPLPEDAHQLQYSISPQFPTNVIGGNKAGNGLPRKLTIRK
jgi:hypothetical protein